MFVSLPSPKLFMPQRSLAGIAVYSPKVTHGVNIKRRLTISNDIHYRTSFASSLSTDIQLRESSQVSFNQYMSDRQRIFQALFPDKRRCEKLNEDDWRIYMLPIEFLFLSVYPVIDMRIVVRPPRDIPLRDVAAGVEKVLTLQVIGWDLRGLDYILKPSDFVLDVSGALYSEKRGPASRLKGNLKMKVSCTFPASMAIIPREAIQNVGEVVLMRLLQNMKERVNSRLLADYENFVNEKFKRLAMPIGQPVT